MSSCLCVWWCVGVVFVVVLSCDMITTIAVQPASPSPSPSQVSPTHSLSHSLSLILSIPSSSCYCLTARLALEKRSTEAVYEEAREEADEAIAQSRQSLRESCDAAGDLSKYTLGGSAAAGSGATAGGVRSARKKRKRLQQARTLVAGDFIGYQCKVRCGAVSFRFISFLHKQVLMGWDGMRW